MFLEVIAETFVPVLRLYLIWIVDEQEVLLVFVNCISDDVLDSQMLSSYVVFLRTMMNQFFFFFANRRVVIVLNDLLYVV